MEVAPTTGIVAPPVEGCLDKRNAVRRLVAGVFHTNAFRMARALPQDVLVVAMAVHEIVNLALSETYDAHEMVQALRALTTAACPQRA